MTRIKIDECLIGDGCPPYVIAEISGNHNGEISKAIELINEAKNAGANAVKFQTYRPDTLTLNCLKPDFVINEGLWAGRSLYDLYSEAQTPWEWHEQLFMYAKKIGITALSSPFDTTAVDLLESLEAPAYKIASFEANDLDLIGCVARTKKPIIISTGMLTAQEIYEAVKTAKDNGSGEVCLLHCVSGYPAPSEEYNLKTLIDMRSRFGVVVGISDHTIGNTTSLAAVALGASVVEKHFTLSRSEGGVDSAFSLEPNELMSLCNDVSKTWGSIGTVSYKRKDSEVSSIKYRRSLYFVKDMKCGEVVSRENVRSIRPGYGIAPKFLSNIVGLKLNRDITIGSAVKFEYFEQAVNKFTED